MLNITFKTDFDFMARLLFRKNEMPTEFANYLWSKYKTSYLNLQKDPESSDIDKNIILELQQQEFFKEYCNEAVKNLTRIKSNWERNRDRINLFLNKIFKKEFLLNTVAIIVAPVLYCGFSIGNNKFVWGHKIGLNDKNYDLVYLVHESLHSYFRNDELTHTIIENISDFELAKFLNNSEKGYTGHAQLTNLHVKILPFWNFYLNKDQGEIEKEKETYNISYDENSFANYKIKLKRMNIDEFVNFLEQLNLDDLIDVKCAYFIKIK